MEKKKKPLLGETSWTSSPPAHAQVTDHLESLASRALIPQKLLEDRVGLARAYDAPESVYIRGNTAYVAGTQIGRFRTGEALRDLIDDAKLPLMAVQKTRRYEQLQEALARHPEMTQLVGHGLGGAAVLEAARQQPSLSTTTYGAPVMDVFAKSSRSVPNRFANYGDPIASFDTNATPSIHTDSPHSFSNFATTSATDSSKGYENPDGTVTLFE